MDICLGAETGAEHGCFFSCFFPCFFPAVGETASYPQFVRNRPRTAVPAGGKADVTKELGLPPLVHVSVFVRL